MAQSRYSTSELSAAREEIRTILIKTARSRGTLTYSDVCDRVEAIRLHPRNQLFFKLLIDISNEEDDAGRGLLSALVVRKSDGTPGPGFFDLARSRGRSFSDERIYWHDEKERVYRRFSADRA